MYIYTTKGIGCLKCSFSSSDHLYFFKHLINDLMICLKRFIFKPIQDGLFRGCLRMGGAFLAPLPKICHTSPTLIKLGTAIPYLRKTQKIYKSCTHHLSSADISIFSPGISKFWYIKKYRYRLDFDT